MKKHSDCLVYYLREFFTVYLPRQRNCSPHTIISSRQTWNMLLDYICASTGKRLDSITFTDLGRKTVMRFLDDMETTRKWTASTRNQRLGCIRSFFKFAASLEPVLFIYFQDLKGIPMKKLPDTSRVMEFLSQDAMGVLLRQPDISTKMGLRDMFFMVLMYDAAARDCEMLSMRHSDINPDKRTVYLLGKGSKLRIVPISRDTVQHFIRYEKVFHQDCKSNSPMFYTIHRHERTLMSDDNVARFITKYAAKAKEVCSDIPERVTPHMFRRSRAMHLYRAGMPLALLAEWLGHEDPETTLIYAFADIEMKRRAIERAELNTSVRPAIDKGSWVGDDEMIKKLCGLA